MKNFLKKVASMVGLYEVMCSREKKAVWNLLANLDTSDPKKRPVNIWDRKFWELAPILYKYDDALDFINTYGHVCETYFTVLSSADFQNLVFQLSLCETVDVCYDGKRCRYPNLLHGFLKHWDFREEVKNEIKNNPDKAPVLRLYNLYRKPF